jgi:parallel beta-helix repeat protein
MTFPRVLRRFYLTAALIFGAAATCLALAPQAHALDCGRTLTRDTTLQSDILNCPGDGLIIGANGVDLNLNGFTIDGTGLGAGVRNNGFDNVTIKNGTISSFDYGIQHATGTLNATVSGVTLSLIQVRAMQLRNTDFSQISQNIIGEGSRGLQVTAGSTDNLFSGNQITRASNDAIVVVGSPRNTFTSNRISWTGDRALAFARSARTTLTGNTIVHNSDAAVSLTYSPSSIVQQNRILDSSDAAFVATSSSFLTFQGNIVRNTGDSLVLTDTAQSKFIGNSLENVSDGGLFVGSSDNVLKDNVLTLIGDTGFSLTDSDHNLIEGNTLTTVGDAGFKLVNSHFNQVLTNSVTGASDSGASLTFSDDNRIFSNSLTYNENGIDLTESHRNVLEANDTTGGLTGGIALDGSYANQLLRNRASATGANGIWLSGLEDGGLGRNVLDGNFAHDNLANGIFVEMRGTRIANNRAHRNAGYGIKGVPGVIDGGGNIARFNREVADCLFVDCNQ